MILTAAAFAAALAVAPADRLAMADRLFNRGEFAAAETEYLALAKEKSIAADEVYYRIAECVAARKDNVKARSLFGELIRRFPNSPRVDRARFRRALLGSDEEKRSELKLLDGDKVDRELRAAALYYLGELNRDPELLARSAKLSPKGDYADYARFHRASILSETAGGDHRQAVSLFVELAFGSKLPLAEEAMYFAALTSYRDRRYDEAGTLLQHYLRRYPKGTHVSAVNDLAAWSEYLSGHYADAMNRAGEGLTDDTSFIRANAAKALGEKEKALEFFRRYLSGFAQGRYRKEAELSLARLEFELLVKPEDAQRRLDAAKRAVTLSAESSDRMRLAWLYEQTGRSADAERGYLDLAAKHPGTPEAAEAMYRKAFLDLRAQKFSAAELSLREALAGKLPERLRAEAEYWCGQSAVSAGHETEGCAMLAKALEHGLELDQSREARLTIAAADFNAGRTEQAIAAYRKLVQEGAAERMTAANLLAVGRILPAAEKKICAQALVRSGADEWRQAGYALLGEAEKELTNMTAAAAAWKAALKFPCETELLAGASLDYGEYLVASGSHEEADAVLRRAVTLNAKNNELRSRAYLALARNSKARGDAEGAKGYATLVVELFGENSSTAAAKALLEEGGAAK